MDPPKSPPLEPTLVTSNTEKQVPRSCKTCRRRKVKCDKLHPCTNCVRHKVPCVYPEVVERPTKVQKGGSTRQNAPGNRTSKKDLLRRLANLESLVSSLGTRQSIEQSPTGRDSSESSSQNSDAESEKQSDSAAQNPASFYSNRVPIGQLAEMNAELGSLLLKDGKSVYVNNFFWANLTTETRQIRDLLEEELEEGVDDEDLDHYSFFFSGNPPSVDISSLSPLPSQVPFYWQTYERNVDPVVKILHRPTIHAVLARASFRMDKMNRGMQSLLFAICFAAVTSMSRDEVELNFGEDKDVLVRKHRHGVERSLVRAGLLTSHDICTLQAFVIYIVCVRGADNKGIVSSLVGVAALLAQNQGLHRDGSKFGLSPYETEIRRRLWWHIAGLDTCNALNVGADPKIHEYTSNTQRPLNINDNDFGPETTEPLKPRKGLTDTLFRLIKDEIYPMMRCLCYTPPGLENQADSLAHNTLDRKEEIVKEFHLRVEEQYLQYLDTSDPMSWIIGTMARLMMSRMWIILYHPYYTYQQTKRPIPLALPPRNDADKNQYNLPLPTRRKLLATSIQILEYTHFLERDPSTVRWRWMFQTFTQWHAIALTLCELAEDPGCPLNERAWKAIDASFAHRLHAPAKAGRLWSLMETLMNNAKDAKCRHEAQSQTAPSLNTQNELSVAAASLRIDVGSEQQLLETSDQLPRDSQKHQSISSALGTNSVSALYSGESPVDAASAPSILSSYPASQTTSFSKNAPQSIPDLTPNVPVDVTFAESQGQAPVFDWAAWTEMVRDAQLDIDVGSCNQTDLNMAVDGSEGWWA